MVDIHPERLEQLLSGVTTSIFRDGELLQRDGDV
jgi:hypothetical protein